MCQQYHNQLCEGPLFSGLVNPGSNSLHLPSLCGLLHYICQPLSGSFFFLVGWSDIVALNSLRDSSLCVISEISTQVCWPVHNPEAHRSCGCLGPCTNFQVSQVKLVHKSLLFPSAPPPRHIDGGPAYSVRPLLRSCCRRRGSPVSGGLRFSP